MDFIYVGMVDDRPVVAFSAEDDLRDWLDRRDILLMDGREGVKVFVLPVGGRHIGDAKRLDLTTLTEMREED